MILAELSFVEECIFKSRLKKKKAKSHRKKKSQDNLHIVPAPFFSNFFFSFNSEDRVNSGNIRSYYNVFIIQFNENNFYAS